MQRRFKKGLIGLVLATLSLSIACGGRQQQVLVEASETIGVGPMQILDASEAGFFSEQRVEIQWGRETQRFHAVLQRRDALLELVLLDPMQRPGFRLYQEREQVGAEAFTSRELPFEPHYMIADVQKAFLPWGDAVACVLDEKREGDYETLHWEEQCRDGQLVERRFWRRDTENTAALTIEYRYAPESGQLQSLRLVNPWFHYALQIDILSWQVL